MSEKQKHGEVLTHVPQMTLRDYFAGQALAGMLSGGANVHDYEFTSAKAYDHADAMLKERNRHDA